MGRFVKTIKERPTVPRRYIVGGLLVVAAIARLFIWYMVHKNKQRQNSQAWVIVDYPDQRNIQQLDQTNPDSQQMRIILDRRSWDYLWYGGIRQLGSYNSTEKVEGMDSPYAFIMDAKSKFDVLPDALKDNPILASEAMYYRAVAQESLALVPVMPKDLSQLNFDDLRPVKKNLDAAAELYRKAAQEYPSTVHGKMAQERYDLLKKDSPTRPQIEKTYEDLLGPLSVRSQMFRGMHQQRKKGAGAIGGP
jgi:hypothetical protein